MSHLYHKVRPMRGTVLKTLYMLEKEDPDIYSELIKNYFGREETLKRRINLFNCQWNDFIHFSPIHPSNINKALEQVVEELGDERKKDIKPLSGEFFQVEGNFFSAENTVFYPYFDEDFDPDGAIQYHPKLIQDIDFVPERTKEFYRRALKGEIQFLYWKLSPHILHKGRIETKNLKRIKI